MRALLIIDVQNDFIPGGNLAVADGDAIVPIINNLIPNYDLVIATQDWHPANHGSFAVNNPGTEIGDLADLNGLPQIMWPAHCIENTAGADFVDGLNVDEIDKVFFKGTDSTVDSYSGFFDNGKRNSTGLDTYLKEQNVTAVDVVGLATDYCVKFTALDAVECGFETTVLTEACRGVELNTGDIENALNELRQTGVIII